MAITRRFLFVLCLLLWVSANCQASWVSLRSALVTNAPIRIPEEVSTPKATRWPSEFSISFTTDNGTAPGYLLYDWGNRQQAIIHGAGAPHCVSRGCPDACYILQNDDGTFEVDPVGEHVRAYLGRREHPPTWMERGVFAGVEDVKGVKCNRFRFPPTMHEWLETVEGGLPCAFVFPTPSFTYFFDAETMNMEQPAESAFTVPDYCPQSGAADGQAEQ